MQFRKAKWNEKTKATALEVYRSGSLSRSERLKMAVDEFNPKINAFGRRKRTTAEVRRKRKEANWVAGRTEAAPRPHGGSCGLGKTLIDPRFNCSQDFKLYSSFNSIVILARKINM